MESQLFTRKWWDSAGSRAANTALAQAATYILLVLSGDSTPLRALSAVALVALASFATSLGGLPEVVGKTVSLGRAVLTRSAKTFGQTLVVWFGTSIFLEELNWTVFAVTVVGPTLVTLLRTLKDYLPETTPVTEGDAVKVLPAPPIENGELL